MPVRQQQEGRPVEACLTDLLDHLGVAAFIQDETSLAIDGGVAQYPITKTKN